jgi:8-oxo-dGTP diphosphatase
MPKDKTVRAAGGVMVRIRSGGEPEIAVIHRPHHLDWTLPKGKLERRESEAEGALREVREETGFRCEIERRLGEVRYTDRFGRPKVVAYFVMRPIEGSFRRNWEADDLRWVTLDEAAELLTYEHDRDLVRTLAAASP